MSNVLTELSPKTCDFRTSSWMLSKFSGGVSFNSFSAASVRSRYTSSIDALSHLPFLERMETT